MSGQVRIPGRRVLVARLDSVGDVLLAGPAVRAVAARGGRVTMMVSSRGVPAAELLPGVERTLVFDAPWVLADPPPVRRTRILAATLRVLAGRFDEALVLTSFHQSPLPLALLLRLAGVPRICAASEDYPGSLLDVRVHLAEDLHEAQRSVELARAAGYSPQGSHLEVHQELPEVDSRVGDRPYVVLHPGADAQARRWPSRSARATVAQLARRGWQVAVTGGPQERALTRYVAGTEGVDLGGMTDLAALAAVLRSARAVVVGNTGPAHLAAAVGTPVVSLFAPTVPAQRWGPHGIPHVILGDQGAACAGSRARTCEVPGHPCLTSVRPDEVCMAVESLVGVAV
jgi:ADP-heptose:LPS heptosyltransferase